MHRILPAQQRDRFERMDQPIAELYGLIIKQHQEVVTRLSELPGLGVDSARQVIAALALVACTFPSAAQLISWVGGYLFRKRTEYRTDEEKSFGATNRIPAVGPKPSDQRCGEKKPAAFSQCFGVFFDDGDIRPPSGPSCVDSAA